MSGLNRVGQASGLPAGIYASQCGAGSPAQAKACPTQTGRLALLLLSSTLALRAETFDVVVYGATAGGVVAGVAAAREGLKVAILEPGKHLGGMTTGGLGRTDHGRKETIGGYSLEFYQRVGKKYGEEVIWYFEPHVAERVMQEMVADAGVKVFFDQRLRDDGGVRKKARRIVEIFTERGLSFEAKVFIDASYEGDLMAQAKVSYTVGREASSQYGESLAGVRPKDPNHQFDFPVNGLGPKAPLPDIQTTPRGNLGQGDVKVQAYNFRMCLSSDPRNQISYPKPKNYDPARYELLLRYIEAWTRHRGQAPGMRDLFGMGEIKNNKLDVNNRGAVSTDLIGGSWGYPNGSYEDRARIWQDHIDYTAGLFWFLANDPRVPEALRKEINSWGLAADEFISTNHWPHQLYVREARRMVGGFVMTQRDIQGTLIKEDAIGMGSYNSDSHNVQRYLQPDSTVQNEGNMEVRVEPYQIPYRVMLPKKKEVTNLLAPVCVSASHVAYSTLRMEPVYMILGQAAGVAAKMAIGSDGNVHGIDTKALGARLRSQGAVMELVMEKVK